MNREQVAKILPILQAFAEGKTIQIRTSGENWVDNPHPMLEVMVRHPGDYRVKPKPRRFTVMVPKPEHPCPARTPELDKGVWYNPNLWERVEVVEDLDASR